MMKHLALAGLILALAACGAPHEPETPTAPSTSVPQITQPLIPDAPDPQDGGDYTPDQQTGLNVYTAGVVAYCADPETGAAMREWATVENITAQVLEQYGFTITSGTAAGIVAACHTA